MAMIDPAKQPTFSRLSGPQEPWLIHDGFDCREWTRYEPHVAGWIEALRKTGKGMPDALPPFPFFIFGQVDVVKVASNIGTGSMECELDFCRQEWSKAAQQHEGRPPVWHDMLIKSLRNASVFLRSEIEQARQRGDRLGAEGPIPEEVRIEQLDTMDRLEAFVRNPQNSRVVSLVTVQLHLCGTWACGDPGTVKFLDDMQHLALDQDFGGLAVVNLEHPAFNARTLLAALNFSHFERLKMVPGNTDHDCSSWVGTPELRKNRNAVTRKLQDTGRGVLVTELIRCNFRVENWFPSALSQGNSPYCGHRPYCARPSYAPHGYPREVSGIDELVVKAQDKKQLEAENTARSKTAEGRKGKNAEKNRRKKEAKKQRQLGQTPSSCVHTPAPSSDAEADDINEMENPTSLEAPLHDGSPSATEDVRKTDDPEKVRQREEAKVRAREEQQHQEQKRKKMELDRQKARTAPWSDPQHKSAERRLAVRKRPKLSVSKKLAFRGNMKPVGQKKRG
ncbi:hypothetical protein B0I37DRAFT_415702 [Chaetomium sp. MPI-CAGE-AT-0009]|nr:hypothetical protein B0I37DRAFT_415702 [Chaetomium sp. MPI-CAGE-AT-0009]